jgi:hypothetical protein
MELLLLTKTRKALADLLPDRNADRKENDDTTGRYKFPYGDFEQVHRCGVLSAESRAGQYKYHDVELAAAHLHGMIDAAK